MPATPDSRSVLFQFRSRFYVREIVRQMRQRRRQLQRFLRHVREFQAVLFLTFNTTPMRAHLRSLWNNGSGKNQRGSRNRSLEYVV